MRTWLSTWILALLLTTAASAGSVKTKIDLTYDLMLQRGATVATADVLDGLASGDRFRMRFTPKQDCFVYLVVQHDPGDFRLLYPNSHADRGQNRLARKKEFIYPKRGWLRLDSTIGMERLYVIFSTVAITELEARYALAETAFPESTLVDIRDRYQNGGSYRREVHGGETRVRFRSRGIPAVLIEEITLRHM
jgi:hypothetical protein